MDPGEIFFIDSRRFLSLTRPQVLLTTPLTIIAVSLAFYAVRSEGGETTWDAHKVRIAYFDAMQTLTSDDQITGFALLAFLIMQELVGLWIHLARLAESKDEQAEGRPPRNYLHIGLGLAVITAGFVQVRLGLSEFGVPDSLYTDGYWL